ncbi:MAG TPA: malto-oligosyltrehalose synthase [Bryobacteraceae bacterium]|nr:malto-oligosyltrehalose synthase [Bryobacteraceae bacterium]
MTPARVPVSTYRIQFTKDFRFLNGRDVVPYLHSLGIGDIYSSPRSRARRGSSHGYDVANPARVNSELGTDEEFDDLCEKLRHYDMGLLLDIVPNHMAASSENPWWMDVLENGPSSRFAHYFDIDWNPTTTKAAFLQENKVLLPVLGDLYGSVLENQELSLRLDETGFFIRFYDHQFPIDPRTYPPILQYCAERLEAELGAGNPAAVELRQLQEIAARMPPRTVTAPDKIEQRYRIARKLKKSIFLLYRDQLNVRMILDAALRDFSGLKDNPGSFDLLHRLLEDQAYRLAFWKIAFEEINYRRFFDINDLVGLRVEIPDVFQARHEIIIKLVSEGKVSGLRIDHIDGLHDPQLYLAYLQSAVSDATGQPFYIIVEKILGRDESLPPDWSACGTTGYDFANALNDLFVDSTGLRLLRQTYARFTGEVVPFAEICYARNKQVLWRLFAGEVNALGHHLGKLAAQDRHARDVPLSELMVALIEVTACLPVYRTYIRSYEVSPGDRASLTQILDLARRRTTENEVGTPAFEFLRRVLLLEPESYAQDQKGEYLRFVMRWQQFTGPVMAKGLEDTAFYVRHTLISMNEVGGDPLRETDPLDAAGFHAFQQTRAECWPYSMNTTSTHDSKRSEDVRARINVLSDIPAEWEKHLYRWRRWNRGEKQQIEGVAAPDPHEEVLIYQTLLGAWPLTAEDSNGFHDRLNAFLIKAVREGKTHSDWLHPNEGYESALLKFLDGILSGEATARFRDDFSSFQETIAWHGALNALSQVLIKTTAPGVPDFYQGSELWTLNLVDPDNRRPVDFAKHAALLEELRRQTIDGLAAQLKDMLTNWKDGRIKLYLTDRALDFRRAHADLFRDGAYVALAAEGSRSGNVFAFARRKEELWCLTVAPLRTADLTKSKGAPLGKAVWRETSLLLPEDAPVHWRNVLTNEALTCVAGSRKSLPLAAILKKFPVALLVSEDPPGIRGARK